MRSMKDRFLISGRRFIVDMQGQEACWSLHKGDSITHEFPTPSAIAGMLRNVWWHKPVQWHVQEIHIVDSGKVASRRLNGYKNMLIKNSLESCNQEAETFNQMMRVAPRGRRLHYRAVVYYTLDREKMGEKDNDVRDGIMFRRRLAAGQFIDQPCFGKREMPCSLRLLKDLQGAEKCMNINRDERVLLCFDYRDLKEPLPVFFNAEIRGGIIKVPHVTEYLELLETDVV